MTSRLSRSLVLLMLLALPLPAIAQQNMAHQNMAGMNMPSTAVPSGSSEAFKAADAKMMKDMDVPLTGDTDRDFVAGMIPHHAGAVDMAEIELKSGKDPALRKLAKNIIAAQQEEIAFMKQWQAAHAQ
ncbi:hypothetical protein GCM10011611_08970 [Aliidongia dinghuensis]|uniref:DUF305 domain-containing protein n=1 Tax=Aliidongia dinghuensis TaxID=1867774 RepID=A0A8J2YQP2_9PROT|nr:DUF305 domain-containing protein [Aliidongia dinghuensis]GGF05706.1 hypothetical protein GCM10011611_08970 [Aliidongia dinghuensis]